MTEAARAAGVGRVCGCSRNLACPRHGDRLKPKACRSLLIVVRTMAVIATWWDRLFCRHPCATRIKTKFESGFIHGDYY